MITDFRHSLQGFVSYISTIAPFLAPFVGGAVFMASFQVTTDLDESLGVEVWRFALTAGLGIFIALIGVIYHNLQKRTEEQEASILSLQSSQQRMLGAFMVIMANMNDGEPKRALVGAIATLMDTEKR